MWYLYQFKAEGFGVIAAGDYNLTEMQLRTLTDGVKISRNAGPTRKGRNARSEAIDHVISTYEMSGIEKLGSLSKSDHIPIKIMVKVKPALCEKPETR